MKDDLNEVKVINSKLSSDRSTEKLLEIKKKFEQMTLEDFIKAVEEAEKIIPERPTIVVKNAKVTGVKLNSKIINSIPQSKEPISFYKGIKVYQDDSLDKPCFMVEGEIETKKYLKWEDLEFNRKEAEYMKVSLNGTKYCLVLTWGFCEPKMVKVKPINLYEEKETEGQTIFLLDGNYINDVQFFNDLHLERVEEWV